MAQETVMSLGPAPPVLVVTVSTCNPPCKQRLAVAGVGTGRWMLVLVWLVVLSPFPPLRHPPCPIPVVPRCHPHCPVPVVPRCHPPCPVPIVSRHHPPCPVPVIPCCHLPCPVPVVISCFSSLGCWCWCVLGRPLLAVHSLLFAVPHR
jgi:hypothetical protein